jgi:hypothetical protein
MSTGYFITANHVLVTCFPGIDPTTTTWTSNHKVFKLIHYDANTGMVLLQRQPEKASHNAEKHVRPKTETCSAVGDDKMRQCK